MTNSEIDERIGAVLTAMVSNDGAAAATAALQLLGNALKNLNTIAAAIERRHLPFIGSQTDVRS